MGLGLKPEITEGQQAVFRFIYGAMVIAILLTIYGLKFWLG
jgi:hypothetical protein